MRYSCGWNGLLTVSQVDRYVGDLLRRARFFSVTSLRAVIGVASPRRQRLLVCPTILSSLWAAGHVTRTEHTSRHPRKLSPESRLWYEYVGGWRTHLEEVPNGNLSPTTLVGGKFGGGTIGQAGGMSEASSPSASSPSASSVVVAADYAPNLSLPTATAIVVVVVNVITLAV